MLATENAFTEYPDIVSFKQLMQMLHIGRNKACNLLKTDNPSIRRQYLFEFISVNLHKTSVLVLFNLTI